VQKGADQTFNRMSLRQQAGRRKHEICNSSRPER